jgi:hypothetical protein
MTYAANVVEWVTCMLEEHVTFQTEKMAAWDFVSNSTLDVSIPRWTEYHFAMRFWLACISAILPPPEPFKE